MAVVAWYLITKTIPEMRADFRADLAALRGENEKLRKSIDTMREAQVESSKLEATELGRVRERLARIDAAISANNPRVEVQTGVGLVPITRDRKPREKDPE